MRVVRSWRWPPSRQLDYEIRVSEDANGRYGAFRVGSHDDLVTALGLAVLVDPRAGQPMAFDGAGRRIA